MNRDDATALRALEAVITADERDDRERAEADARDERRDVAAAERFDHCDHRYGDPKPCMDWD